MTVTQHHLAQILGSARLQKFIRAGWLAPAQRTAHKLLFDSRDVRACLRRLERHETLPPDRAAVIRVRASELKNGRERTRKEKKPRPSGFDGVELDFSAFESFTGSSVPAEHDKQFARVTL
jgi:hypothetical protein